MSSKFTSNDKQLNDGMAPPSLAAAHIKRKITSSLLLASLLLYLLSSNNACLQRDWACLPCKASYILPYNTYSTLPLAHAPTHPPTHTSPHPSHRAKSHRRPWPNQPSPPLQQLREQSSELELPAARVQLGLVHKLKLAPLGVKGALLE